MSRYSTYNTHNYTENEALQHTDSGSPLVDLFKNAPTFRDFTLKNRNDVVKEFVNAYADNPKLATKIMFWLRDPRMGQGEKASARKLLSYMYNLDESHKLIKDNLEKIIEYGSYKDLVFIFNNTKNQSPLTTFFADKIKSKDRLACKWAPRFDSKDDNFAIAIRDELKMTNKEYRTWIKDNSETVEQMMARNYWREIDYSKIPSYAMKQYGKAFDKHDADRFKDFKLDKTQKINVSVLYPHQVANHVGIDSLLADKMWENLPNYIKEGEIILPIIDVSGSMDMYNVLKIALSLGLYLSERISGPFKNKFITFSENPKLININPEKYKTLKEKLDYIERSNWGGTTNFHASYELILNSAKMFKIKQEDMPTMLICLSDMQFNTANNRGELALTAMRQKFKDAGYLMPKLVMWDLRGKDQENRGSHAKHDEKGVALISGFSPSIMKAVLALEKVPEFTPYDVMMEAIEYIEFDSKNLPQMIPYNESISEGIIFNVVSKP